MRFTRPIISRLGVKLFAIILVVNVAISGLVFMSVSRSLDKGFIDYLENTQANRAQTLADTLGEQWARHDGWQWLREDARAWEELVYQLLWPGYSEPPQSVEGTLGDARDFVLHDAGSLPVIGLAPRGENDDPVVLNWLPIEYEGERVGTLGYRTPRELMADMDRLFLSRQQRNLAVIMVSLALASLLLAGGLGWWLGRRARRMAMATQRLIGGDYSIRLSERGHDELSRLAHDFNMLAVTLEANRASRQRWVADIAHELRTPLAVLRGEIEALQDGIRPLDDDSLHSLSQEVGQLEWLIRDLRLLAQSDAGSLEVNLVRLDIAGALRERLEEARGWLQGAGITLEIDIAGPVFVLGDLQRLRQLWNNLLTNTRAYTDSPGRLRVSLTIVNSQAQVIWEDSAPGVGEEELPRLTERLYRVDASRSRRRGGSGLGLSIASALVQAHNGRWQASHSPLGGVRWTLTLPLAELPLASSPPIARLPLVELPSAEQGKER
ncbi:two-component system, OmpR family, sensor histidine kinase BaeS [Modicisalibacter ilicicola DSM 19980]|uniref:histidine kinase n=1 Tax=Modicisalibacter ilicicola DSM 19980 TaxID=1121942 RepID=A0A1M5A070_9GAMM|nr:ATP-binding protein [Halomonas ilicicola]SHF23665.1 two-component system, OmpR family, sensor histidine kinase BaeS [Halomonas ilicicola DSM 19980]